MSPLAWILLSVLTILIIILIIRAARNKKKKKGKVSVQMPAEEEHSTQNGQLSCDVCGSHAIIKSGDSFYCQECGCRYTLEEMQARLAARPCRQPSCPPNAPAPKKNSRGCLITFIIIVVILAAILIPIIVSNVSSGTGNSNYSGISGNSSNHTPSITHRDARNSDITVQSSGDLTINPKFTFIPSSDISGLRLCITLADKNKNTLSSETKYIGDVQKGQQYTISASVADLSFFDYLKISYLSVEVVGGTVSYLK